VSWNILPLRSRHNVSPTRRTLTGTNDTQRPADHLSHVLSTAATWPMGSSGDHLLPSLKFQTSSQVRLFETPHVKHTWYAIVISSWVCGVNLVTFLWRSHHLQPAT